MTPRQASIQRVARSWLLTKLFPASQSQKKRDDGRRPPPAVALSEREREKVLDDAYESIKRSLITAIRGQVGAMNQAETRLAKKYNLDPLFLNWYLVNGRNWPSMPQRTRDSLKAMQSVRMWFGAIPSSWSRMETPPPEKGKSRDKAIKEMGEWFLKNVVARVEREFGKKIWQKSRELAHIFKGPTAKPDARASLLLMQDFERRLKSDGFQLKPAVRRIVELFE